MLTHLFLYNQLQTGQEYHNILRLHNPVYVCRGRVDEYSLWKIGGVVPAAVKQRDSIIYGELWVVSSQCLIRLDQFEFVKDGSFERESVRFSPLEFFRDRSPFLVDMYVWQTGIGQKNTVRVKDGILV